MLWEKCSYTMFKAVRNYKHFYSMVMLALVDTDYRFHWVDVGRNGSFSDTQVFNNCYMKENIVDGTIRFPNIDQLPGDD